MKRFKKGITNIGFVIFIMVFILITVLTVEYYRIYTLKEHIDTEMSRALNIAVDTAMNEMAWMEHISYMDTNTARDAFLEYLHEDMGLDGQNRKYDSEGKFQYQLIITEENLQESPAEYAVSGAIKLQPALMRNMMNTFSGSEFYFEIPFKQKSRNQRYDE